KRKLDLESARSVGQQLLAVLDAELSGRQFLVGGSATTADIAIYSYTAHAPEGEISPEPYPNVRAWLVRVEALPGFVAMKRVG
ncbi:MAG TPA: glutathione binding-like protein, partial [Polyangiales bacterium]